MRNSQGERTDVFFRKESRLTTYSLQSNDEDEADKGKSRGDLEIELHGLVDAETSCRGPDKGHGEEHQQNALGQEDENINRPESGDAAGHEHDYTEAENHEGLESRSNMEESEQRAAIFQHGAFEDFRLGFSDVERRYAHGAREEHEVGDKGRNHDGVMPEGAVGKLVFDNVQQGEVRRADAGFMADHHGHGKQHHEQRQLVAEHDDHLTGEADSAEGRARRGAAQHKGDGRYGQQVEEDEQVAHVVHAVENTGNRNEGCAGSHAGESDDGSEEEDGLAGRLGDHLLLGHQLGDINEGLVERRADTALQPRHEAPVKAFEVKGHQQGEYSSGEYAEMDKSPEYICHFLILPAGFEGILTQVSEEGGQSAENAGRANPVCAFFGAETAVMNIDFMQLHEALDEPASGREGKYLEKLIDAACCLKRTRASKNSLGSDGVLEYVAKDLGVNPEVVVKKIQEKPFEMKRVLNKYMDMILHNMVLYKLDYNTDNGVLISECAITELVSDLMDRFGKDFDYSKWIQESFNKVHSEIFKGVPYLQYENGVIHKYDSKVA